MTARRTPGTTGISAFAGDALHLGAHCARATRDWLNQRIEDMNDHRNDDPYRGRDRSRRADPTHAAGFAPRHDDPRGSDDGGSRGGYGRSGYVPRQGSQGGEGMGGDDPFAGGQGQAQGRHGSAGYGRDDGGYGHAGDAGRRTGAHGRQADPAAPSFRGRGPKGYVRTDARIAEELNERLSDDDTVDASEIELEVRDGVVTLTGSVGHRWMKHRAEDIAEACSGVKDVDNRIRVQAGGV
jgi:hypothetical protein